MGFTDIFVRDRRTGTTERVSVSTLGEETNNSSFVPSISPDGRRVAFYSFATNLVPNDSNDVPDVFVRDLAGTTTRVSVSSGGEQGNDWSTIGGVRGPVMSYDGRYVVYLSRASNLVPDDTNGGYDVFLHDTVTGTTERVSLGSQGAQLTGGSGLPTISADGRYVAFDLRDHSSTVSPALQGDIFVRDRVSGTTVLASVSTNGQRALLVSEAAVISGDGHFVAFESRSPNAALGDVNGSTEVVSMI
jgi:Tol biopolymer transport system component